MNEREDYLDRLLRGVEGEPDKADDFFSSYESSVSQEDEDDFLKAFEKSMSQSGGEPNAKLNEESDFDMDDIDSIVSNIKNGALDDLDEFGSLDDGTDLPIDESLGSYQEDDAELNGIGAGYGAKESEFEVNTIDGEDDTDYQAGKANQELLDMLSGIGEDSQEDADTSEGFSAEESFVSEEGEDGGTQDDSLTDTPQEELSEAESLARELEGLGLEDTDQPEVLGEKAPSGDEKKDGKQKQQEGEKLGFFQRLSLMLFGEEDKVIDASEDIENLSEEDAAALKKAVSEEEAKERKKQEKELRKEQKKKEKEEKKAQKAKEKQEKPKKEKKPKPPKEVRVIERTKPLPKMPVFLIMLVGVSLVILINLFTSQVGYTLSISQAKEFYEQGEYVEAYSCFTQGKKVKAVDEELYNKSRLTAYIQQQMNSYKVYQKQGMYAEALSALVLGVGRYDKNAYEAAASGAAVEYEKMLASMEKSLKKKYKMSLDQARELYAIRDKEEFTMKIYETIESLGLE